MLMWSLPLQAQDSRQPAKISERQSELNDDAVRAIIRDDHETAVALLTESLAYGEANVTYLNLGRAYQNLEKCARARSALESAKTAPAVDEPSPAVIDKKADEYLAELDETCAEEAPDAPAEASTKDDSADGTANDVASGLEEANEPQPRSTSNTLPMIGIFSGGALVATGVTFFVLAANERADVQNAARDGRVVDYPDTEIADAERRASTFDSVGLATSIGGAVLLGAGTYFLIRGSQPEDAVTLGVSVSNGGANAAIRLRF